jgi:hypothetical protein
MDDEGITKVLERHRDGHAGSWDSWYYFENNYWIYYSKSSKGGKLYP